MEEKKMAETIRELVSEKAVDERIVELGKQISKDYEAGTFNLRTERRSLLHV